MKIKAVIFDLDGVIVSTDECHYKGWKKVADEEGIYFDKKINDRLRGVSRMESLEIVLERAERVYSQEEKQVLAERKNNYYKEYIQELTPKDILPGVMRNLEDLKHASIKIAIGSSSKNTPIILQRVGLSGYFDAVSDGNNIVNSKPAPDVFIKAAEMLSIEEKYCMIVEDADAGIIAGKNAGMYTVAVNGAMGADFSFESLEKNRIMSVVRLLEKK